MSRSSWRDLYPLHWLVWHNEAQELAKAIESKQNDVDKLDPRGRTPLMLAVTLGHLESTRILLQSNANVNIENRDGWTVIHEAVATGDPELLQLVLERREYQRYNSRVCGVPQLLARLNEAPDFYVEMKWEFTSWVPLVSRMCPSDTYKVYKRGSNVRIDTTLLGFDQSSWQRGSRSYIFKGQTESATMMEIDHDTRQVYVEQMSVVPFNAEDAATMRPSDESISSRLTSPMVTTYIDTDKICFERNKSGIWGWRSDKIEHVNNYECKVYGASNVELVTKTRTEHLTEADKARSQATRTPLQSFLGIADVETPSSNNEAESENVVAESSRGNPSNISADEYFNPSISLNKQDIGRPKEISAKVQKFKAHLWLCDDYPLSLQEQVMPIVDLMAISSTHFAKLKDFITLQLPSGFPVKIEIPLFHVLNARITFGNILGLEETVTGVQHVREPDGQLLCNLDDSCFEAPVGYMRLGSGGIRRQLSLDDDDELLQFAIQQSLIEAGSEEDQVTLWEALKNQRPLRSSLPDLHAEEEEMLQRAIQESLGINQSGAGAALDPSTLANQIPCLPLPPVSVNRNSPSVEEQLQRALELSQLEEAEAEEHRRQEEELLRRILELSLTEK